REFLADRVDEALQDSRSVDLDSLAEVAKEHGVSIRAKTGKRATGLTYALVDENGEVRRPGRSKFASTGTKLGADYTYEEGLVRLLVSAMEKQEEGLGYREAASEELEKEMSTRASTQDSTPPSELRSLVNMQREMNETLSAIGKTVSDERVVKTSGGETVTA